MLKELLKSLNQSQARALLDDWSFWARPEQLPPDGDWQCWLFLGGRGAGKTRAGAEWIRGLISAGSAGHIALVGPSLGDVREVMIEGASGLGGLGGFEDRPRYESSRRRLLWPNGAQAYVFSAEDPDSLRGPQFDAAWCDEIASWPRPEQCWDTLMLALRLGMRPRVMATTTPRPTPLIRRLIKMSESGMAAMSHATMHDNAAFLAPGFVETVEAIYGNSHLARQEIRGELIDDPHGAMWTRRMIEESRLRICPELEQIVVSIDPPSGIGRDECGIIAAGKDSDDIYYVLADASSHGLRPLEWAEQAVGLAKRLKADSFVAEGNQGGEMVREMLRLAGSSLPVRLVYARKAKTARAEPIAALYGRSKVRHVGVFGRLEDQMCSFGSDVAGGSPDRLDALVWAIWALCNEGGPRLHSL